MKTYDEKLFETILEYVKQYQKDVGRSPSYRNIKNKLNIESLAKVQRYIKVLNSRGLLQKDEIGAIATPFNLQKGKTVRAPIVGSVACGELTTAIEEYEATIELPTCIFGDGETYVLQAKGESMIEAGIDSGDWLVIKRDTDFQDGDIIIAMVDDEATAKRVYVEKDRIILHPENKKMKDIIVDNKKEVRFRGRVVNVIKTVTRFKIKD